MELGFSQLGIKLKFQGRWRMILALTILLIVCLVFFSLPAIARFYNDERAVKFQQADDLLAAIRNYRRAVSLDPDYAIARYNLANAYEDVMEFDKAMAEYQGALLADPKFLFAYNNLARLYLTRRMDYTNALNILDTALALDPQESDINYTLYKNRGWAHFGLGLYELAADDLSEALKWRNGGAAAHCLLAQVLEAQGRKDAALPEWTMCVKYEPGETDVEPSWLRLAWLALKQGGNQ
jgi:tetratricopeptide (TPR) repeat protein